MISFERSQAEAFFRCLLDFDGTIGCSSVTMTLSGGILTCLHLPSHQCVDLEGDMIFEKYVSARE